MNGFGTPTAIYLLYVVKLVVFTIGLIVRVPAFFRVVDTVASVPNDTLVTPSIIISGPLSSATFVYSTPKDVVVISGNYLRLLLPRPCCYTLSSSSCGCGLVKLFVYLLV